MVWKPGKLQLKETVQYLTVRDAKIQSESDLIGFVRISEP